MKETIAEKNYKTKISDKGNINTPITTDFKILSLDGGGIKGLYAAKLLAQIEEKTGKLVGEYFDMICGTSTGGLLALGITNHIPCQTIAEFYMRHGPLIFPRGNWFQRKLRIVSQIGLGTKYDNLKLKESLKELLGELKTMQDANHLICIPSFNITKGRPSVFKKPFGLYHRDGRYTMMDVALATSAAPTYLPAFKIEGDQFIDGGIYNNNPSMIGYTEAMDHFVGMDKPFVSKEILYESVSMLSIGLPGQPIGEKPKINSTRSFLRWRDKLVGTAMSGSDYITQYQVKKLIEIGNGNYYRLDPPQLSPNQLKHITMDNTAETAIHTLNTYGQDVGDDYTSTKWSEINKFFNNSKTYKF